MRLIRRGATQTGTGTGCIAVAQVRPYNSPRALDPLSRKAKQVDQVPEKIFEIGPEALLFEACGRPVEHICDGTHGQSRFEERAPLGR